MLTYNCIDCGGEINASWLGAFMNAGCMVIKGDDNNWLWRCGVCSEAYFKANTEEEIAND